MPIASATARTSLPRGLRSMIAPWVAIVLLSLLWFTAGTLLVRRLAGAFEVPLSWLSLFTVGAIAAMLAVAIRLTWRPLRYSSAGISRQRQETIQRALPTAGLLMLGAALSLPSASPLGLVALWTLLVLEELWAWAPPRYDFFRRQARPPKGVAVDIRPRQNAAREEVAAEDESVLQQMIRTATDEGQEIIRGQVRVPFLTGQRTAAAHLAFCPAFDETPQTEFRQVSGPGARIKLSHVYPYGARFDLKLSAPASESTSIVLDFSIAGKTAQV